MGFKRRSCGGADNTGGVVTKGALGGTHRRGGGNMEGLIEDDGGREK